MEQIHLNREQSISMIDSIKESDFEYEFDTQRYLISIIHKDIRIGQLYLPLDLKINTDLEVDELYTSCYTITLIQSGACALGYFEDDDMLDHKVFKTYMVRKKQGKSQLTHLNTKGKSRAGSRIRLANSIQFFEDINERQQEYFEEYDIDRIAISCSKTLWPFLFDSKTQCPFKKDDQRLYKIPIHVNTPNYEQLEHTHLYLQKGHLHFEHDHKQLIEGLLWH